MLIISFFTNSNLHLTKKFSPKQVIIFSLIFVSIFLIILVLTPILFPNQTGFVICLILCFIIGSFVSIGQNNMIALSNLMDGSLLGLYWVGSAVSGLVMNVLRAFALVTFRNPKDGQIYGAIVYFSMAVLINVITGLPFLKFT